MFRDTGSTLRVSWIQTDDVELAQNKGDSAEKRVHGIQSPADQFLEERSCYADPVVLALVKPGVWYMHGRKASSVLSI